MVRERFPNGRPDGEWGTVRVMYEIEIGGLKTTVTATALMNAWSESSPVAVGQVIALPIHGVAVVWRGPCIIVRRIS